MTAWTNPPALYKEKCFEIYRKEVLAWGELTDLPKSKQGIVVALHHGNVSVQKTPQICT